MNRRSPKLIAEPELLIWAREGTDRTVDQAAEYIHAEKQFPRLRIVEAKNWRKKELKRVPK